jgi:transposase
MYSSEIINLFLNHTINGMKQKEISKCLNVSVKQLKIWKGYYKENIEKGIGINEVKFRTPMIHNKNKRYFYREIVEEYVEENKGCGISDIYLAINKELSLSTICRLLKDLNITLKTINNRIVLRNPEYIKNERKNFYINTIKSGIDLENVYSTDEVHFCINDCKRKGYSKVNEPIKKLLKHSKNRETRSMIMTISNTQIVSYKIFNTSIKSQDYLEYLNNNSLNNKMNILDNCRIHHSTIIKEYCIENDFTSLFIPPYTPEYNPIEFVFSELKGIYRKNDFINNIDERIKTSINQVNSLNFKNYYKKVIDTIKSYKD